MTAVRSVTKIVDQDDYATVVGAANGIATLDGSGKLTPAQTPIIDIGHLGFDPETETEAGVAHAALQAQIAAEAATRGTADTTEAAARAAADALLIPLTQKAAANGVATLDGTSKLTAAQLPLSVGSSSLRGRIMALLGDSISALNGDLPQSRHPGAQAVLVSGGRLIHTTPFATAGFRSDEIIATHLANAIASTADVIPVLAGTNDIAQGIPNTTIATNLVTMWAAIKQAGKLPVACTVPPNNAWTNAQRKQLRALNLWIASQAARHSSGLPLADYFTGLVGPTTGIYDSGLLLTDGTNTHPNGNGAAIMGPILFNALDRFLPGGTMPLMAYGDSTGNAASGNRMDNPLMLRATVAAPVPDGVGVTTPGSPVNVYSTPAAVAPGVGNTLHVVTGIGASASLLRCFLSSNAVTPGDRVVFGFRIGWAPAAHATLKLALVNADDGVTNIGGFKLWDTTIPPGSVWWEEIVVPAGVVNIEPRIYFDNDGTPTTAASVFDLGQTTLHDLTADLPVFV